MFYNTIDLDKVDKQQLNAIVNKIQAKPCCLSLQYKDSSSKGYHISLICKKACEICRLVFDDQKRLEMDSNRDMKFRNTLFSSKEFVKGNLKTIEHSCERCAKYGNDQTLSRRVLSFNETLEIIKKGKVSKKWNAKLIYMGYDYLECPVCQWGKFVKMGTINIERMKEAFKIP